MDIAFLSAAELSKAFANRSISPVEATEAALEKIGRHDRVLNAFRRFDASAAIQGARASERRWHAGVPLSPIDGVPTSVKDLLLTKGWPTSRGSLLINTAQPWEEDSPGVARLREAGAILLGKTNTAEFGWKGTTDSPLAGVTRNPWNIELTPGGSSGGAASALASGMGALALCTDGGGSIRNPASFTGLCGLKPTFGRVPAYPPNPIGTLANTGPLARRVIDLALMMNVITRPDARDWLSLPPSDVDYSAAIAPPIKGLRIAYSPDLGFAKLDPEVALAVNAAAETFETLGAHVELADPGIGDVAPIIKTHWLVGIASALGGLPDEQLNLLDPGLDDFVRKGRSIDLTDYVAAQNKRIELGQRMRLFHEQWDLLLLPTTAVPAFPANRRAPPGVGEDDWAEWTPFSYPFNLTLQPAVSIPCGFAADGRPIGLQIVGGMYRDDLVLRAARAYEEANPLYNRHPQLN
jgi:aspartyl-tRNA(Asn)/glutamyl-tRNA(Gln) amidotransferase subunit A